MKLTMLGTGGAFTRIRANYHNNALIEVGDTRYLLDCSLYAFDALADEFDIEPLDIDGALITHLHGDHVSGLEELGFRGFFVGDERPELYCHPDLLPGLMESADEPKLDLWHHCLRGAMQNIRTLDGEAKQARLETYFRPRVGEQFTLGDESESIECRWISTEHAPGAASFGLALENRQGRRMWYSGDSLPKSAEFYRSYDVILHDCLLLPHYPGTMHTHLDELQKLPPAIRRRIHIMHYGDIGTAREMTSELELRVAEPGSVFSL